MIFFTISGCYIVAPARALFLASLLFPERTLRQIRPIKVPAKWPILFSGNAATGSAGANPSPGSLTGGDRDKT